MAAGLRIGHPGFSGWVTTAPTTIGAVADLVQAIASPQRYWATPANFVDDLAMRWLIDLLGFPAGFVGSFTSGGSTANLVGLGAARQAAGERLGLRPSLDGIAGIPEPRVYASAETHHVVGRALGVLGMGRANLRSIPVDGDGRIDLDLLQRALDEDAAAGRTAVAIVGCAGDVNTGVVDPLPELARIARERETWLHVDGAYGGFGLLDPRVRDLYGDVATYDSFAVDPHKWMAAPVGTGAAIVRDEGILGRAFTIETGDYDSDRLAVRGTGDTESPFDDLGYGMPTGASTSRCRPAAWRSGRQLLEIGADGMRERVVRHNDCARRVADRARASGELELLREPVLSIACFRYVPGRRRDSPADPPPGQRRSAPRRPQRGDPPRRPGARSLHHLLDAGRRALRHPAVLRQPAVGPGGRGRARRRGARGGAAAGADIVVGTRPTVSLRFWRIPRRWQHGARP